MKVFRVAVAEEENYNNNASYLVLKVFKVAEVEDSITTRITTITTTTTTEIKKELRERNTENNTNRKLDRKKQKETGNFVTETEFILAHSNVRRRYT